MRKLGMTAGVTAAILTAVIALLFVWYGPLAAPRGRFSAEVDLHRGRFVLLTYGLPPLDSNEYERILRQRYGIEVRRVADCIVSSSEIAFVDAYDHISMAAAQNRFGPNIFIDAQIEADAATRRLHPEYYRASSQ
jgi:hypothetical protein